MLLLTSISDLIRLNTDTATSTIEVHTSYMDVNGSTITPSRTNTLITTATTTTIVASPAAATQRNVKAIYITNNSAGTTCTVTVSHTDGTNSVELVQYVLFPGESMVYSEDGKWLHRNAYGAEYASTGSALPLGGATGQALLKNSVSDLDTVWTSLTKSMVGLSAVNNTSDANKPVSTAQAAAISAAVAAQPEFFTIAVGDETTAITTGTAKVTFRMPFALTLTGVRASLTTASTSGIPTFDINQNGVSVISTKLTIDANEKTSVTAATAAVISTSALTNDAEITIDVDVAGTGAAGAKITLLGTRA